MISNRSEMMKTILSMVVGAGLVGAAQAGVVTSSGSLSLYGSSYGVTTWSIRGDATGNPAHLFGAEGMTFHNGTLYVSHDHDANRAAGRLVRYTPGAAGDLTSFNTVLMGNGPAGLWGPEGITINTSGSGYGSYAPGASVRVTGIETRGTDSFGIFDTGAPGSNMITPINSNPALDDIAWVGSLSSFVGVEDGSGNTAFLRYFDSNTMQVQASSYQVIDGAKGVAVVSAAFAQALTGQSVATAQAFLVVGEFDGFAFYDTNGASIGLAQVLNAYAPINELESVAVDEANNLIFLGDEAGTSIHVVQIPTPAGLALLGLGALVGRRRR
jgi:hypothetical protein